MLDALKTDVFELPDNKNIGKLFPKYELFFMDRCFSCATQSSSCYTTVFPIFSNPIRQHVTNIGYTKPYAKSSQSRLLSSYIQIIIPYWSNMLSIKKLYLQESTTTQSTTTLFSIQSALSSLQIGRFSFIFTTLPVYTTTPTISTKKLVRHIS